MQAGTIAFGRGRGGRQLRFFASVAALTLVNGWLWTRVAVDIGNDGAVDSLELTLTGLASLATLGLVVALWRSPVSRNVQLMATPALRQALATHHAGHIVATHREDPTRIRRVDLAEPCHRHRSDIPIVTQSSHRAEMMIALAGMTAEEVFAGESGSHAARDLAHATGLAVDMVGRYGMAGSLVSLGSIQQRRSRLIARALDDPRTRKDIETLLREAKRDTVRTMLEGRHIVIALRDALMRTGRLDAGEIRDLIASAEQVRHTDDEVLVDLRVVTNKPAVGEL
ncbi:MAG: hypothetical protein QNJ81_07125 [Acidimicrobiia bacterium]|nr:hypothetical protein [Acidimicrobiia bacterium]